MSFSPKRSFLAKPRIQHWRHLVWKGRRKRGFLLLRDHHHAMCRAECKWIHIKRGLCAQCRNSKITWNQFWCNILRLKAESSEPLETQNMPKVISRKFWMIENFFLKFTHCVVLPFPILILWRRVGLFSLLRDFILAPSTLDSEHVKKYDLIMERRNGDCLFRDRRLDLHYMQILTEFVFSFSGKVPGSVSLHKKLSLWSPPFLSMYEID